MVAAIMYHSSRRSRLCSCRRQVTQVVAGFGEPNNLSAERRTQDLNPGPPEVNENREQCAGVQGNIKRQSRIAPVGYSQLGNKPGDERQMGGAGDRQEFCKALHDTEDNCFEDGQTIPPWAQMWACCFESCTADAAPASTSQYCRGIAK